jgi:hypothetical protein
VSQRIKLLSLIFLVLAAVFGAQYIRATVRYHETSNIIASTSISPGELTVLAGALPNTAVDSYF